MTAADEAERFIMELLSEPAEPQPGWRADDLAELDSSHFDAMRHAFDDLLTYDSATLIGMYQLAPQPPQQQPLPLPQTRQFPELLSVDLDDDQALEQLRPQQLQKSQFAACSEAALLAMRRRSDSGYSASTRSPCSEGSSYCESNSPQQVPLPLPQPPPPPPPLSLWQSDEKPPTAGGLDEGFSDTARGRCRAGFQSKFRIGKIRKPKSRQLQLWEFLYQLLHEASDSPALVWESRADGVFRIERPAALAEAWGRHRCRSSMTYEKMSRTLRYYYEKQLITKVTGRQHTYRFHYDKFPQ
ncbi:hypothetical protein BOX15_Mlig029661g1 [Macrostomum lignano]|uniref:ETS domain-containing protein n=1 Tax=Macrostomum lignano TaxID=282301 RepID=A0A267F2K1_9PLAT|nr:hypothetical protein BOX15_Mlig029661g1 [Macrostomum lignano]